MTAPVRLSVKQVRSYRDCTARVNLWNGSVSSGKTFISALAWARYIKAAPNGALAMIGKTHTVLERNVLDPLRALLGDDPRPDLDRVRCRTLLVWGARDRLVPLSDGFEYARRLRAPIRTLPDSGHLVVGELAGSEWDNFTTAPHSKTLEEVLAGRLGGLGVPVLYNLPLGHGSSLATLPLGVEATLDADAKTLTIDEPALR